MADNYLEKQMADFRAGKLNARRSSPMSRPQPLKPGQIDMGRRRILVACSGYDDTETMVRLLRSTGARVAFIATPDSDGTALAQTTGARFYPVRHSGCLTDQQADAVLADLLHNWHGLDMVAGNLSPLCNLNKDQSTR